MARFLSVHVQWFGATVDHRICRAEEGTWLGDRSDAAVGFPGMSLCVATDAWGWTIGGHRLVEGRPLSLHHDDVEIRIELLAVDPSLGVIRELPDPVPFVATAAMVLFGLWLQSANRVLDEPLVAASVQAILVGQQQVASPPEAVDTEERELQWRPVVELLPME